MLKVIAICAQTEANEILDALVHWAYHLPREQWLEILYTYRRKKREDDNKG